MPDRTSFLFLITAYNVETFLPLLLQSLSVQVHPQWRAVFVDDASTDRTLALLGQLLKEHSLNDRFTVLSNDVNRGKAHNVYQTLVSHGREHDVVVMLDADDHLATPQALTRLDREYRNGWEIVWSNWKGSDGMPGSSYYLHPFLSARAQPFVTSHLFSFRWRLAAELRPADFQDDNGRWVRAAADVALALPLLSQTIKRKFIPDVLCIYNRSNPLSIDKKGKRINPLVSEEQHRVTALLSRRPERECPIDDEFFREHLYEFMQAAALSNRFLARVDVTNQVRAQLREWDKRPVTR